MKQKINKDPIPELTQDLDITTNNHRQAVRVGKWIDENIGIEYSINSFPQNPTSEGNLTVFDITIDEKNKLIDFIKNDNKGAKL
jgi:hypothetical protein